MAAGVGVEAEAILDLQSSLKSQRSPNRLNMRSQKEQVEVVGLVEDAGPIPQQSCAASRERALSMVWGGKREALSH